MHRELSIDMAACTLCEGCLELVPEVFSLNEAGGYIEVAELDDYPLERVQEAIADCPAQAITWQEVAE